MRISYSPAQVAKAAEFIWENNPHVTAWLEKPACIADVERIIMGHIRRQANQYSKAPEDYNSWSFTATGGFYVLMAAESDDWLSVDVLVDPAVGGHDFEWLVKDPSTDW